MREIARETDRANHSHQVSVFFSDAALEIVIFSTKNSTVNNSSVLKVFRQNFVLQLLTNYAALFPASFA